MTTRLLSALVAAWLLFALPMAWGEEPSSCPMDHTEKAFYCDGCKAFLDHAGCGKCTGPDWCEQCKKDSWCEKCKAQARPALSCLRVGFACDRCKTMQLTKGDCAGCKSATVERPVRALVVFACPGCGAKADQPGHCAKCDKDLVPQCHDSGALPHTAK